MSSLQGHDTACQAGIQPSRIKVGKQGWVAAQAQSTCEATLPSCAPRKPEATGKMLLMQQNVHCEAVEIATSVCLSESQKHVLAPLNT
jgi:hypothetical protein